ncbi:MAG: beta-propeller domain-containing protein [Clostridia bacterium]|nr:beta-propeller domain-containing protein [Clostridia bacterium]
MIYQLGEQTLLPEDSAALLSYSGRIFVSGSDIFVTRPYVEYRNTAEQMVAHAMLEIARVSYADGALTYQGAVSVEGIMKDQYSMDVHNGVLRVVTTTREVRRGEYQKQNLINAGLFCIDVAQMQVVARVEHFAPDGESVQSVRFDGTKAYVCTAVALTDPVFCFDLSNLSNITHTSTGNIPGFSSSLIQLGDGYLLGVGKGGDGMLKIEVYRAQDDAVTSVCSYTRTARFSEEYKSYFIDRERGLIGLVVQNLNDLLGTEYILLRFDGEKLSELVCESVDGFYIGARSTLIDGYIYVLSWGLSVFPVELN